MKIYCVSHKSPTFQSVDNFILCSSKKHGFAREIIIPDDFYGEIFHGDILSEYTQLFGLADYLSTNENSEEKIYIFQYRKFITTKQAFQRSTNIPYLYSYSPSDASTYFPTISELSNLSGLLVGPIAKFKSVAYHYSQTHLIEDYCKFMCSLSASNVFSNARCAKFADCKLLIPAPSLGITQVGLFVSQMNTLKEIWLHFYENFYIQRQGYQRRVGGFLLERLHSYLILEEIHKRKYKFSVGKQIVVSNNLNILKSE
jgi:hypothetical protein